MSTAFPIVRDLAPLNRVFCSEDYDRCVEYLCGILPFTVHEYPAGDSYNGWMVPPKWDLRDARILRDGKTFYDATKHPLQVIALSAPFRGRVSRDELKKHLHYDHRRDDVLPFHFRQQYRSWDRDWGFCVPHLLYDTLPLGDYEVIIETDEAPGVLKVPELHLSGSLPETFVFLSHPDHPGMANDGLASTAVAVELFRRLKDRNLKWSYRLVLPQEIIGSEYYWGRTLRGQRGELFEGVFLDMLGTETSFALQASREGRTMMERAIETVLRERGEAFTHKGYRQVICNDEHNWENYGVPTCGLSRWPYEQYHSDRDSLDIISPDALEESVIVLERAVELLESATLVRKKFRGTVCLSHPDYNLYIDPGQPAFGTDASGDATKLHALMERIPALKQPVTLEALAAECQLDTDVARTYLERWAAKGLIELA